MESHCRVSGVTRTLTPPPGQLYDNDKWKNDDDNSTPKCQPTGVVLVVAAAERRNKRILLSERVLLFPTEGITGKSKYCDSVLFGDNKLFSF